MRERTPAALLAASLLLAACGDPNNLDPSGGGFVGGLVGLTSGAYAANEQAMIANRDAERERLRRVALAEDRAVATAGRTTAALSDARALSKAAGVAAAEAEAEGLAIAEETEALSRRLETTQKMLAGTKTELAAVRARSGCGTEAQCKRIEAELLAEIAELEREIASFESAIR